MCPNERLFSVKLEHAITISPDFCRIFRYFLVKHQKELIAAGGAEKYAMHSMHGVQNSIYTLYYATYTQIK